MFCVSVCFLCFVVSCRTNIEREVPLYFVFCGVVARVLGVDVASYRMRAQISTSGGEGNNHNSQSRGKRPHAFTVSIT